MAQVPTLTVISMLHPDLRTRVLPKKGTWGDLVARFPVGVTAKDAKGISETIRHLTERLCTGRDRVLNHDSKWTDLTRVRQEMALH